MRAIPVHGVRFGKGFIRKASTRANHFVLPLDRGRGLPEVKPSEVLPFLGVGNFTTFYDEIAQITSARNTALFLGKDDSNFRALDTRVQVGAFQIESDMFLQA